MYSSSDIIRKMKSRSKKWTGHVADIRVMHNFYTVLLENLEEAVWDILV
jgi:hypothetical protein